MRIGYCMRSIACHDSLVRVKSVRSIGALVRDQRKERGWSQTELAGKVGVSRLWIGNLEKGKESVEAGLLMKTLRVLGLALDVSPEKQPALEIFTSDYGKP